LGRQKLRLALSCTAIIAGVALGTASAFVGSRSVGWTFRVAQGGPPFSFDPALLGGGIANSPVQWATCAKLFTYPDLSGPAATRLRPEVASKVSVSSSGKTYTFTLRKGFRFSTGEPVTAASFARAINRDLSPQFTTPSPGAGYLFDVVGASKVADGKTDRASGVHASGYTLRIAFLHPAPDIIARLALNYFCAVPPDLAVKPTGPIPGAGPYFISHVDANTTVLERNRFYRGNRPRHPEKIVWTFNQPFDSLPTEVESGDADTANISPGATVAVAAKYPGRFHQVPDTAVACLALNTSRPLFRSRSLRRAVSYAIDRRALTAQWGLYAERTIDHYLPAAMPGHRNVSIYGTKPNLKKARALAKGHVPPGAEAVMYLRNGSSPAFARAQIVQQDLAKIGITVDITPFSPDRDAARRGAPFDIVDSGCWFAEYPDPYAVLNLSFDGDLIRAKGNTNFSYFNSARFNQRLEAASRLKGAARYRAYGKIDVDLARTQAPAVAYATFNSSPVFVSRRIGCIRMNPVYGLSYGALCHKG
jgi:peptide/nickel transport system substrate-binding protein